MVRRASSTGRVAPLDARMVVFEAAGKAIRVCKSVESYTLPGPPYTQVIRIWGRTDPVGFVRQGFEQVDALTFSKTADSLGDLMI